MRNIQIRFHPRRALYHCHRTRPLTQNLRRQLTSLPWTLIHLLAPVTELGSELKRIFHPKFPRIDNQRKRLRSTRGLAGDELLPRFHIQTFLFPQKSRKSGFQILDFYCSRPSLTLYDPENWNLTLGEGYAGFMFSQIHTKLMERFLLIIRLGRTEASLDIV